MKKLALLCLFAIPALSNFADAQSVGPEVIASGGNVFSTSTYSLSWTLGEPAITYLGYSGGALSQGFQQAYDVLYTGVEKFEVSENFKMNIFPNPVAENLGIRFSAPSTQAMKIEVLDINGRVLSHNTVNAGAMNAELKLEGLPAATYLLRVSSSETSLNKTFHFIKN